MTKKIFLTLLLISAPALAYAAPVSPELTLDSRIESMKKAGVGPVIYPHAKHEKLYKCADCHPKIFKEKRGTSEISMKKNMEGQACGSANCHNSEKAFPLYNCTRCHTNVKVVKPKK